MAEARPLLIFVVRWECLRLLLLNPPMEKKEKKSAADHCTGQPLQRAWPHSRLDIVPE